MDTKHNINVNKLSYLRIQSVFLLFVAMTNPYTFKFKVSSLPLCKHSHQSLIKGAKPNFGIRMNLALCNYY